MLTSIARPAHEDAVAAIRSCVSHERLFRRLRRLVEIESYATQVEGVAEVGAVVVEDLAGAGLEWRPVSLLPARPGEEWLGELFLPGRDYDTLAPAIVARKPGRGPRVVLLGDLDTAYQPGALSNFPFRVEAGRAYGPGIADMKGGLSVMAEALVALSASGLSAPDISVVLSPDEQAGSIGSRRVIERELMASDYCLSMECAREGGKLLGRRAQCGAAVVEVAGQEGHVGSAFAASTDAIAGLARIVAAIDELTDMSEGVYVVATMVAGGRRRSLVSGHARCIVDVRTRDQASWDEAERAIRSRVAAAAPPCAARVQVGSHRPAVAPDEDGGELAETVLAAAEDLHESLGVTQSAAGGSSAFAGGLGVPVMDGMGPSGGDLMTDHEYVEISSLASRACLLALTLHYLAVPDFQ